MAVILKNQGGAEAIQRVSFNNEAELQKLLADNPSLLQNEAEPSLAFVKREVNLGSSGYLDLLLINRDGLPIAVEVKLQKNAESRREVVAQAIDYITALTDKTVDELGEETGAQLSQAIRSFDESDVEFERRWRAIGANLRAGLARLIVAVDGANPGLERMLRFLAEKSELDVQLVVVEQYKGAGDLSVFVGRQTFTQASVSDAPSRTVDNSRLLEAVTKYNETATADLTAVGISQNYRQIRPLGWPQGCRTHYELYQTTSYIGVELHIESDFASPLSTLLSPLAGKVIGSGHKALIWDSAWNSGRGRLAARFPHETDPAIISSAMKELIELTFAAASTKLSELAQQRLQAAAS
jgi:hypothetical protein